MMMTHGEAVRVVQESLVSVMAGVSVFVEDGGPLYAALLTLVDEDGRKARRHSQAGEHARERGYHGADGWPVSVR